MALEGLPFTGKSTAALSLQRDTSTVSVIVDYHELLTPVDRKGMATLSPTATDQRARLRRYQSLDDRRWAMRRETNSPTVIFDRCFVSIAAYRSALWRTFGTSLWGSPDADDLADTRCEKALPPEILYFEVDLDVTLDRHAKLAQTIDPRLRTKEFLSNLIKAYAEVTGHCGSTVVTIDSNLPLDDVVHAVNDYVQNDAL